MSDLSQTLSLEEEFLEVESEYGGCTRVDTDTESSDIENEQSQYPYFLSPSHDFDTSVHDDREKAAIEGFECKCKFGEPCCKSISVELIINYRSSCLELSKDELDLVILGQIHSHYVPLTSDSDRRKTSYSSHYFFHNKPICLKTFLFVHAISDKRYRNLVEHYRTNSPAIHTRSHGNFGRKSYKAASLSSVEDALQFIKNTASAMALPVPGRLPNFKDERFLLLPTDMTKAELYRRYKKACEKDEKAPFSRTKFIDLWLRQLPFIKPATDLCWDCQQNCSLVMRSINLSEQEKSDRLEQAKHHLKLAAIQRDHYNSNVQKCCEEWDARDETTAYTGPMHISFDYAQQVHYPCNALQPGPLFFKTARKCNLFGVACEPTKTQLNYLIDEAAYIGKGSDATVSLIHDFLENRGVKGKQLYLQADNCVGQNKNNIVVHYLCWRVSTGKNESVSLSFMLAGHTKFAPDRYFGLIKRKYKHSRVDTMVDIENAVLSSTVSGANKAQLIQDGSGKTLVTWYNWKDFLDQFYKNVPNITTYHHFRMDKDNPGVVYVKEYANSPEKAVHTFKSRVPSDQMPDKIIPPGIDAQRQWYLYEQIRPFCGSNLAADLTCPKPQIPKPGERKDTSTSSTNQPPNTQEGSSSSTSTSKKRPPPKDDTVDPSTPKRQRLCSHCRMPGHVKSRGAKITCPKLLEAKKRS